MKRGCLTEKQGRILQDIADEVPSIGYHSYARFVGDEAAEGRCVGSENITLAWYDLREVHDKLRSHKTRRRLSAAMKVLSKHIPRVHRSP